MSKAEAVQGKGERNYNTASFQKSLSESKQTQVQDHKDHDFIFILREAESASTSLAQGLLHPQNAGDGEVCVSYELR